MASCSRTLEKSVYSIRTLPDLGRRQTASETSLDLAQPKGSKVKFVFGRPVLDDVCTKNISTLSRPSLFSPVDDVSFDTISKESHQFGRPNGIDIFGVRVIPAAVSFLNTFENQSYVETVYVQNISKTPVIIRIHNPRAWSFRLTPIERGYLLAPGLKITRHIHFTCTKLGIVHSTLPIYVNDKCFELPLESAKGQAFVEIVPTAIDFGRVDIGSKPVEKKLVVRNVSSCATKFLVDLGRNELQLQVTPLKGWIRPHSAVTIRIQLIALEVGDFTSEIWITTDLCQSRIPVEVLACERSLLVLHPNSTSDLTLIDFPKTFYGCKRYQTIVVYNMAAASSAFVVLADFGNQVLLPLREARKICTQKMNMFNVEPDEGRIRPFEGRIFTIWFQPTPPEEPKVGWKHQATEEVRDVMCAVRIKRIQVDDLGAISENMGDEKISSMQTTLKKRSSIPNMDLLMQEVRGPQDLPSAPLTDDISVLLCLYGEAEPADLTVQPDRLHFPATSIGTREDKVVSISNNSCNLLAFRSVKIPFFDVSPNFKKVAPKESCDVTVSYCARSLGNLPKKIVFEVLAFVDSMDESDLQVVNQLVVKICGKVKSEQVIPQPKFNPGITPMVTNEVGFFTEKVTFDSKVQKPICAMLGVNENGRPWVKTSATIAFPNDMPLTLRPRETDSTAKTIFTGLKRYIAPVDESLTYTMEKLLQKKAHDLYFLNYIRGTAAISHYKQRDHCCKLKVLDQESDPPLLKESERENVPQDDLVPLSFIQLYRIKISPILISFGSVTTSKNCTQLLMIGNQNNFQISAKVLPLSSGIHVQTLESFTVEPKSETKVKLTFHRETLGRYSGTISCVINGHHSFDITVVAEVVPKTLSVAPERVEYRLSQVPFTLGFVPISVKNQLNAPVSFSWAILEGSPFKVEPIVGVTPRKGMVWCAAYFEPTNPNYKLHPLKLLVEGATNHKIKTGAVLSKPLVYFLEPSLNIGYIPLQLTIVKRFFVFNPDFCDTMFVILNKEPIKGVTVEPSLGTVKARSCYTLALHICASKEGALDFVVYMTCQNSATIEMKVTGTVVYPHVDIGPKLITLTRVPSHSVTTTKMFAENKSKARTEVNFNMDEYPQFKMSFSKNIFDNGLPANGFHLEPGAIQKFYLHFIPKDLASYDFMLPVIINHDIVYKNFPAKDIEVIAKKIKIGYRKSSSSDSGKPAPKPVPKLMSVLPHMVLIDVAVLKPQLLLSETEIYFTHNSETKTFQATNVNDEPIYLMIRSDEANQSQFIITVKDGHRDKERKSTLKCMVLPGDSVTVTIQFSATEKGNYITDITVDFYVQDHAINYNCVRLNGTISPACFLYSSISEIYFSPVPLGVDTNYYFHLIVNSERQYEAIIITCETNISGILKVEFPGGNVIDYKSTAKKIVPVKVTFKSNFSISLKKCITFYANKGSECVVTIAATSDNCLLTTHAFVKTHISYRGTLKENESLENMDSNEQLCKDENILQQNQQVFGYRSSKQDNTSSGGSVLSAIMSSTTAATTDSPTKVNIATKSDLELTSQLGNQEEKVLCDSESVAVMGDMTSEPEDSVFPLFPLEPSITEYAVHMNCTLHAVESWAYEQVFNCSYHPILGSYSFSAFTVNKKQYGGSLSVALSNVFDVLERICGRSVRRYFTPLERLPEEGIAKAQFTHNVYRQLLDFMGVQGALLCHVEPKYLMSYDDYCVYCKSSTSTSRSNDTNVDSYCNSDLVSETLDYDSFKSISIQCWLDLFLQMFKTFMLNPLTGVKINPQGQENLSKRSTSPDLEIKRTVYSRSEEMLMTWLTHNFNIQRVILWPEEPPPSRTVKNFDSNLEDGLILTAATAAHCPFLTPLHFQNMFSHPNTVSQAYHNTVCLTMAWDQIKLGFSVTPRDFVRPNPIKMIMLVVHLYKTLPSYQPEATVKFKATLNSSETQVVTLENLEESTVTYTIDILPSMSSFVLEDSKTTLVLKRKQKGRITVRYTARNATKVDAILLLCGASMPPKFGPNYVFALEGNPGKLPVSSVFKIISPLNVASTTSIAIESPHNMENRSEEVIHYDIWVTETEPQPGNINALSWAKERKRKIPRRLFILSEKLTIEVGQRQKIARLILQVCCFSPAVSSYWLLFMNPEIGDFIIKLQIAPGPPEPSKTLVAMIDPHGRCSCLSDNVRSFNCSRTAVVNIPCRNLDQWAAVRTMFELTISPSERDFWTTYIESHIGLRLLQWMLEEKKETLNTEIELIFKQNKTYSVSCKSPLIYCVPTLEIPNVRSKGLASVLLHCNEETQNMITTLTLTSTDEQEIRCYILKIISHY